MGAPMARRLAKAGFEVHAWNRTPDKLKPLAVDGVILADRPDLAAHEADALIIMLSNGAVCDETLLGEGAEVARSLRLGGTVVVMSSIPVDVAKRQAARCGELGINYVDAPVSGGERGAIAGELAIMAGGDSVVIASLSAMFAELGRLTHVGPVGSGQLAKLANQLIVGVTIGAVSEALLLAEAGGADPEAVRDALLGGFAESAILRQHGARMVERDFAPGAHATTQLKDLETIQDLAAALALELRFAALAREQFGRMCAGSGASLDHSALYLEMRRAHPGVFS
jgi:2-hydroxy-3-oxopropionate reductase